MLSLTLACLFLCAPLPQKADPDGDRDGLSDFQELHKYGTNPKKADSDGDGIEDGDWLERREYAYSVRSVVQVLKPVTIEFLSDDFQDARLLFEGEDYVELEVIHYPFNTVNDEIGSSSKWRRPKKELKHWLKPGPTSDWTPKMRKELLADLLADGIDVGKLDDKEVVQQVSKWLMQHAEYHDGFSSFITSFDKDGKPYIKDELLEAAEAGMKKDGVTLDEQWETKISARGMYEKGTRGSCTSSAIYISGCMRAVGIPTRTILCIPLVDANDEREVALVKSRLQHNEVRRIVASSTKQAKGSWTSHTFNEVWIDGRWRRLNYDNLGQNILDSHFLGLMTHVGTFHDWADANMPDTVGRRASLRTQRELFGGPNPYSTVSLSDQFGVHCKLENPPEGQITHKVLELLWTDSDQLPENIADSFEKTNRFGLVALVDHFEDKATTNKFLAGADLRIWLENSEHPRLGIGFATNYYWLVNGKAYIYVPFGTNDKRDLVEGVTYRATAGNDATQYTWDLDLEIQR